VSVEVIIKADPFASANGKVIAVPFQFLSTGEDHLRVRSFNSLAGVVLTIDMRTLNTAGEIQVSSSPHTPNSDRSAKVTTIALAPGYILNLVVRASAGSPTIGQTYVIVELVRGLGTNAQLLGQLLGGYVTAQQGLAWPGSPIESSIAGGGWFRSFEGTIPAAGQQVVETVPTGARWDVRLVRVDLLADAIGLNRLIALMYRTPAALFVAVHLPIVSIPPGNFNVCLWQRGPVSGSPTGTGIAVGSLAEEVTLMAGDSIRTSTFNMEATDQFVEVVLGVREWLEAA
jgi:hypothetical protein